MSSRAAAATNPRPLVAVDARPLAVVGNGVSRLVSELVRALRKRDDVRLLLLSNRPAHPSHDLAGLDQVVDDAWAKRPGTLWLMMRMNAMARCHGADMVWGTSHVLPPRSRRLGRIVSIHDLVHLVMPESMRSMHLWASRVLVDRSIRTADAVVALSRTTARDIERMLQVNPRKITTILPGNSLDATTPDSDMPALPPRYLFALGSLEPRKNIDGLLAAFEHLTLTHPDLHLVLTGLHSWRAEAIMAVLDKPALRGRVVLTGYLTDAQVMGCMRAAEAFVMASHYEGFGLPILEAAGKTRIILSNTPIFHEVSGYLRNALLVDFGSPVEAARSIGHAIDSAKQVTDLAPVWCDELHWDKAATRHAQVFKQVMEMRNP